MKKNTEIAVSGKLVQGRQLVMFPHFDYSHGLISSCVVISSVILFLFYQLFLVLSYFKFLLCVR